MRRSAVYCMDKIAWMLAGVGILSIFEKIGWLGMAIIN